MSCCFTDLGRVPHNEPIDLKIVAEKTGKYVFRLNYLGSIIYQEQTVESGDDLKIPGPVNESFTYELKVLDPDGLFVVNPENADCDTWIFTTFIGIKNSCNGTTECDDDVSDNISDNIYS